VAFAGKQQLNVMLVKPRERIAFDLRLPMGLSFLLL
jgi:hypothetical protein